MEDRAGTWAHLYLDQLGSHWAVIQNMDDFKREFLVAFGDPDVTRAAEHKITMLTQTGTCAKYITKFCTLATELDWNNMALHGQFSQGLHWENTALIIDNALCEEHASHLPKGNKPGSSTTTPNRGASTSQQATRSGPFSSDPNFVSEEEQNQHHVEGTCIKCGKMGCKFVECHTGWKATPKEDKRKPKETAKIDRQVNHLEVLIDSGATSSFLHPCTAEALCLPLIDLPEPCTATMLTRLSPKAGKIWKKANMTFSFDGKQMTETFLICNTGSHAAILGLKCQQILSIPHSPLEHVAIAKEEEADPNPLEGVPPKYHQYTKVFGEEEFHKLPPHQHYNIGIELMEEGPLNSPLYSMTDVESATLKNWLRDKLKSGKIHPSKLSISSPVMFIPKKDGSH
ncbi:Retrotransposable element Tf2 protein [Rhizoctonia solani]|uniref:Retrotransposable element Tf2 protein n=1 Tax=Rhizoctonia solani TaxID=456999 RepID=A0A8H8NQE6_9AGAM|nr:Retrotransposable element Tf2 protein [Rhizoctonia solani]QRW17989.1 Retrotransposable element Tf2 protein [Rhizoctonia solani]